MRAISHVVARLGAGVVVSLLALVLILAAPAATAGIIDPAFDDHLDTLPADAKVSVLIYLADQVPIASLDAELRAEEATLPERHERVITDLRAVAEATQGPLRAELEARRSTAAVTDYTPYWIANLIVAEMTVAAVREIAARPDVGIVYANFTASLIEPVGGTPKADDPAGAGPQGIGVTPGLRAINATRVWYELGINGSGRLVGGLDTGVMGTHVALASRWRGNQGGIPWQWAWRDLIGTNTTTPIDTNGHGTHTMGTMVGLGATTQDTVGVAWAAQWIACNAINQGVGSAFDNDIINAFQWFADPDGNPQTSNDVPDVLQNSWRINENFPGGYTDCDPRWWAVMDALEAAGCAVVFSAGNEGPSAQTIGSPPDRITTLTNAYAVGAVDATSFPFPYPIASFSSRGPSGCAGSTQQRIKPEVVAPGVTVYSSTNNGGYQQSGWNGTSMAGPHVSGVMALMRQANPNIDVVTMKNIVMSTARDLGTAGEDNTYGWGVIDAYAAVRQALLCGTPVELASGVSAPTTAPASYHRFNQPTIYWSAAAVRGDDPAADYDIGVYQNGTGGPGDFCFSGPLASSTYVAGTTDFVIGDFNHNPLGNYYVHSYRYSGTGNARTEWDNGADQLVVNGAWPQRTTDASDLIEVWDVFLEAGKTYSVYFNGYGASMKLLLYRNSGSTYWVSRSLRELEMSFGVSTYTPPVSDWHGLVVANDDGGTGAYELGIGACEAPVALASGVSVPTPQIAGLYSFNQQAGYWSAVGVRSVGSDWDLGVYQNPSGGNWPVCLSGTLGTSTRVAGVDFVIGDFNSGQNPLGTYYASAYRFSGPDDAVTEWDDGVDAIGVGNPPLIRTTGPGDVLEVWDVFLLQGTDYDFFFERIGGGDTKLLLFQSFGGAYWTGRNSAVFETASLHTPFTAPATDWYGVVVVNDDGQNGQYRLGISPASAAVADGGAGAPPAATRLRPVVPNPSSGEVQIGFDLAEPGEVDLTIHDVTGRAVVSLPARTWGAGSWEMRWNGKDAGGRPLPAGVYWVRMAIGSREVGQSKLLLVR